MARRTDRTDAPRPRAPARRAAAAHGTHSREGIIAAALAVLRRGGLAELSMRRVASELGAAPMSLYRHVRNKDELVELVMGSLAAGASPAEGAAASHPEVPWRDALTALLGGVRATLRAHPGAAELFNSAMLRRTQAFGAVEAALGALGRAGLGPADAARVAAALWSFTVGAVLAEHAAGAAWPGEEVPASERAQWVAETVAATRDTYPAVATAAPRWVALSHDEVFARGLALMLDGVAAAARSRRRRAPRG